jgi:acetylornithine deacetylase/succinyl-diaminopimelate desuccinylase-like protein
VEIDPTALVSFASELIRIDSRNPWLVEGGAGEARVASMLADRARAIPGAEVAVELVAPNRPNVLVRIKGTGQGRTLCLNAHVDTVGDAAWPDRAMKPVARGDRLFGLGAADDKGHCAAVLLALDAIGRGGHRLAGDIVGAFVVDEEALSLGTQALVGSSKLDAAIVVEPLGLGRVLVTHQGFGWVDLTIHGRPAHGSAPEQGIDAISHAARVIEALDDLARGWAARPHPLNGATVYHASTIRGGTDYATYPATVTIGIEIGTQPGESIEDRLRDIRRIYAELERELPGFRADVSVRVAREPFVAVGHEDLQSCLDRAAEDVIGRAPRPVGENAWMDAALLQAAGIPTLSIGASGGNLHAPDEWVSIDELVALTRVLVRTCEEYAGPAIVTETGGDGC